jgi:hypothetical protein
LLFSHILLTPWHEKGLQQQMYKETGKPLSILDTFFVENDDTYTKQESPL